MLNANKTRCMFVGTREFLSQISPDTNMQVNDNKIVPCKSFHFDNHMQFDTYINESSRKIYGTIMYINRLKDNQ